MPLRILMIDDNPDDRALVVRAVRQVLPDAEIAAVPDKAQFDQLLAAQAWDVVVTDFQLRWSTGLEVLRTVRARFPELPVIMFTASGSEEVAAEAMKEGLDDYITKTPKHYARVPFAVRAAAERATQRADRRRLEEERDRALARLQLADRQKDEFLATLSHELRNPLAPIRYAARLLRPGMREQDVERLRGMLERQSAHMARLLDDLLDVSRITRNAIVLERVVLDLRKPAELGVETARPLVDALGHTLTVELAPQPVMVVGDQARLAQVVSNLLHNAAKFTDAPGQLRLTLAAEGEHAVLRMQDNGIGIPPDRVPELFALFSQLHRERSGSQGGLGIGLSVVKHLVEQHGGSVEARSAGPGTGSEFIVRLPLAESVMPAAEVAAAMERSEGDRIQVLLADDNGDAADALGAVLQTCGYDVHIAYDGTTAIARAGELRPRVIVLDIGMPGATGNEVARWVRQQPWGGDTLLIAVTGWGQERDREATRDAGFDEHLVKPADALALDALIRKRLPNG